MSDHIISKWFLRRIKSLWIIIVGNLHTSLPEDLIHLEQIMYNGLSYYWPLALYKSEDKDEEILWYECP